MLESLLLDLTKYIFSALKPTGTSLELMEQYFPVFGVVRKIDFITAKGLMITTDFKKERISHFLCIVT